MIDEDSDPINDEGPDPQTLCTDFLFIVNFTMCDLFGQIPRRAALGGSTKLQRLNDQKSNIKKNRIEITCTGPLRHNFHHHTDCVLDPPAQDFVILFGRFIYNVTCCMVWSITVLI